MLIYYIPINDTPFQLHVFWPFDTEKRIKLIFSESVLLSLKMRLMTLLNISDTLFELHVFWPSDIDNHIKLVISESVLGVVGWCDGAG